MRSSALKTLRNCVPLNITCKVSLRSLVSLKLRAILSLEHNVLHTHYRGQ